MNKEAFQLLLKRMDQQDDEMKEIKKDVKIILKKVWRNEGKKIVVTSILSAVVALVVSVLQGWSAQ